MNDERLTFVRETTYDEDYPEEVATYGARIYFMNTNGNLSINLENDSFDDDCNDIVYFASFSFTDEEANALRAYLNQHYPEG